MTTDREHSWKLLNETLMHSKQYRRVFLILDCLQFQISPIENFLSEFSFGSISSVHTSVSYAYAPYKWFLVKCV